MNTLSVLGLAVVMSVSGLAKGGISDFYATNSTGSIFLVDGDSLNASLVVDLNYGSSINDILYLDDGGILANVTGALVRYDLNTGQEEVVFQMSGNTGLSGFQYSMGLAAMSNGDVYFSLFNLDANGSNWYGGAYDPFQNEVELHPSSAGPAALYFDHHQIGENLFIGADHAGQNFYIHNTETGEIEIHAAGYSPVSFFESGGSLFTMTQHGGLYMLDVSTMSSTFYGRINSGESNWIGAATTSSPYRLPSPGSLPLFGFVAVVGTRRRR